MDEDKGITTNELTKEPTEEEQKEMEKEEEEPDPEKVWIRQLYSQKSNRGKKSLMPYQILEEFVALHEYARKQHFYCFFCGTRYDNEEDIEKNCPGFLEEDHDW